MRVPRPPSGLGDVIRWTRDIYDYLTSIDDIPSPNTLLTKTTKGTGRSALPGGEGGGTTDVGEVRQWDAGTEYVKDQFAFAGTTTERQDGTQAGLYQALEDVTGGDHPSISSSWIYIGYWSGPYLHFRSGTGKIVIDVSGTLPSIKLYKDYADESAGSILLDIASFNFIDEGTYKVATLRENTFCVGPTLKRITWLCTEPYDVPA